MWLMFLIIGLLVLCLLILLLIAMKYQRGYWQYLDIPHERPKKLWDIVKALATHSLSSEQSRIAHYSALYARFKGTGPFCGFYALLQPRALVLDRELIKQIMIKDFSNFNDRGLYSNRQGDPLSGDLYGLRGNSWKEMRLKLDPIFEKERMSWLYGSIYEEAELLLTTMEHTLTQQLHRTLHIQQLMRQYVLSALASCVFGLDSTLRRKYPLAQFEEMTQLVLGTREHGYFMNLFMIRFPNASRRMRLRTTPKKAEIYFMTLIADVVEQRQKSGVRRQDFLQLLMDLRAQELNTHEDVGDQKDIKEHLDHELAAHAFVFLKAGYEHTANTISYVLYELASNAEIQQRLREEVQQAMRRNNQNLDYKCIESLKYMGQVISETLRMHPVTPYIIRRTLTDYQLPDHPKYILTKELFVIIPTHAMHHDADYYAEPTIFRPERFEGPTNRTRDISTWFGFGVGARNCIGIHFAQLQMRLALSMLILQYEFTLNSKRPLVSIDDGIALQVTVLGEIEPGEQERAV